MDSSVPSQEITVLREIALRGSERAAESLGMFSGNTLTVGNLAVQVMPVEQIPRLLDDPEEVIVGVNFSIEGSISGYLLAYFKQHDANLLLESLIGAQPTSLSDLGELECSALGEAGNIIVSSFLSCLESLCGLTVLPSPPAVAVEMYGAILTSAVLPVAEDGSDILLIEADITPVGDVEHAASCRIMFLPTADSWKILRQSFWSHRQAADAPVQ